jgi:hypothetical protein
MTVRDFVMLSLGELILMLTFGLGIVIGISLTRKESRHGNRDEETNERDRTGGV